jgi:hypothetical protein
LKSDKGKTTSQETGTQVDNYKNSHEELKTEIKFEKGTKTLSIMTLSIMTLSIMTHSVITHIIMSLFIMTHSIMTLIIMTLSIMTLKNETH